MPSRVPYTITVLCLVTPLSPCCNGRVLLYQYKLHLNEVVHTIPTVGFNVERVEYRKMEMMIW